MSGQKKQPTNMVKGNLLEDVVTLLHDDPNVIVEKKKLLPSAQNPQHSREIDVLATGLILGRPMHIAIECKNYGKPIGPGKIGEFRDRLDDVGIPMQHGIFVAAAGFTQGARDRAKSLGIRLLSLEGLSQDRLRSEIHDAFRSIVYLLAVVTRVSITSDATEASTMDLFFLKNAEGRIVGSVPDLIWEKWRSGKIPRELGDHRVGIEIPPGWQWLIDGLRVRSSVEATVSVKGLVATETGQGHRFALRNIETGAIERGRVEAEFQRSGRVMMPVVTATTESELRDLLSRPALAHVQVGRIPLPRIVFNGNMYWPPSLRVALEMKRLTMDLARRRAWKPGALKNMSLAEIEGPDLSAMWEPIMPDHPAARDECWPWNDSKRLRRNKPKAHPTRRVRNVAPVRKSP